MNAIRVGLDGLISLLEKGGKMDEKGKTSNFCECMNSAKRSGRRAFERCFRTFERSSSGLSGSKGRSNERSNVAFVHSNVRGHLPLSQ